MYLPGTLDKELFRGAVRHALVSKDAKILPALVCQPWAYFRLFKEDARE
jgi:hypothetical protein